MEPNEVADLALLHWFAGNRTFACDIVRVADPPIGILVAAIVAAAAGQEFVDCLRERIAHGNRT